MIFSKHFIQQIQIRTIAMSEVEEALNHPDGITSEDGLTVYQKRIIVDNKLYWLRIFVNEIKDPPVAVTAYKTSKFDKYNLA